IVVGIEKSLIARSEPAVREGAGVGFGIVLVATNDVRTLYHDLATFAVWKMPAARVHDADADVGSSPHGSRLPLGRRQWIGRHLMGGFGHTIRLEHRRAERGF